MLCAREFLVRPAEIVGASDQIHAGLQGAQTVSGMPTLAREHCQPFTHRRIEPLNKSGVEQDASFACLKQPVGLRKEPEGHLAGHLHHPFLLGALDHSGNTEMWAHLQTCSPSFQRPFQLFAKGALDALRVSIPAIGTHQECSQGLTTRAHLRQQPIRQTAITRQAHHSSQPQARRDHHRQTHPGYHFAPFHPNFIGLNMLQVQLPLLHDSLMDLLTMVPCSISPTGHRAFV